MLCMMGYPQWKIYSRNAEGKAKLAEAMNASKVIIETARAQAAAEKLRAQGVSDAISKIGGGLKGNPEYLRYLWVNGLNDKDNNTVIYVPMKGNLPILEATRLSQIKVKK